MSSPTPTASARIREWTTYRRLLEYVRPYRFRLYVGVTFGLVFAGLNGALLYVGRGGLKDVFEPSTAGTGMLISAVILLPLVALLRGVADFISTYCVQWVGFRVVMDLRNGMFRHLLDLPVAFFSQSRTGELISRTSNDTTVVERAVSSVIGDLAKQPATLLCMMIGIIILDARLAFISLVVFPICILPIAIFGRRVRRYARQAQERIADVISIMQEAFSGVRIVKAFGMEEHENGRFDGQTRAFFSRMMRVVTASAIVEPIIVLIAVCGISALLIYINLFRLKFYDFFFFVGALFMMYEPVKKLSKVWVQIQQSSAAADRIFELLDAPNTVADAPHATPLPTPLTTIEFRDVSFAYENTPILNHVSLTVKAGERIAVVGGSGAGKTTLVNLIPRFYDVSSGAVCIDGTDLRRFTLQSLRSRIGLVTQDTFLFNDTVANNISYGARESSSPEAIEQAARRAYAHDFIMEWPERYATIVGERGVRMSGGQRQRLAIARAIMRNPPILILDEATNALDTESERIVQAALEQLMAGRTAFIIAHRLSTIVNCDRILVMEAGRIVEEGTHPALLDKGGAYKRLYDLQFEA